MQLASGAVRAGRAALGQLLLGAALVVQCGYLAYQLHDLDGQLAQFRPGRDAYASVYYTLLVADHAHVALGVVLAAWLVIRLGARRDDVPRECGARDRLVLALRQRPDARRHGRPALGADMSLRRLSVLQWLGLLVGAGAWGAQFLSGYWVTQTRCATGGVRLANDAWQAALMASGVALRARGRGGRARRPAADRRHELRGGRPAARPHPLLRHRRGGRERRLPR